MTHSQNVFETTYPSSSIPNTQPGKGWADMANIHRSLGQVKELGQLVARVLSVRGGIYNLGVDDGHTRQVIEQFADACKPPLEGTERGTFVTSAVDAVTEYAPAKRDYDNKMYRLALALEGKG